MNEQVRSRIRAETLSKIRDAVALQDWNHVETLAGHWMLTDPSYAGAHKWLARAAIAKGDLTKAVYSYTRLLDMDPQNQEARKFFAERALPISQKAGPTDSKTSSQHKTLVSPDLRERLAAKEEELAETYYEAKIYGEAAQAFRRSFDLLPRPQVALGLAQALAANLQMREAVDFLRKQLEMHPQWIAGRTLLAKIYVHKKFYLDAQKEFQNILRFDPNHEEALRGLQKLATL